MGNQSPTGVIPEELLRPQKLREVMAFLKALPVDGHSKRELLFGWARTVGVKLNAAQLSEVEESGIDRQPT